MKRSGWVLAAAGLALLLAPLCAFAAVKTRFVAPTGIDDSTEAGRGESAAYPFKTLAYAMAALPQAKADTNVVLRIFGAELGTTYLADTLGLNPRKPPTGGGRYFIYGDLDNIGRVKIDRVPLGASANASPICSTYTTWAGVTFTDGIDFSDNPRNDTTWYAGREGPVDSARLAHTRRRMRDTLRNCTIVGDLTIKGSNITVANVTMLTSSDTTGGNILINRTSADWDIDDGNPDENLERKVSRGRSRGVDVHLYNITATAHKRGRGFLSVGNASDTFTVPDKGRVQHVDSLRIWFSNFAGDLYTGGGTNKASQFFHCTNLSLRGNNWRWHHKNPSTTEKGLVHAIRDSMDNIQMDCDTVIILGSTDRTMIQWNENVSRSGGGRAYPIIDSCYFQVYDMEWRGLLSGSYTYTTFVVGERLDLNNDTGRIDSLQTVVFNHCNFITTNSQTGVVFPIGNIKQTGGPPYGWPQRGDSGNVVVFKNNIVARCDSLRFYPDSTNNGLMYWGWIGDLTSATQDPNNTRTVSKKITTDWNLYLGGGMCETNGEYGDRSIGWQGKGSYFGDYLRAASKPGHGKPWKTFADSSAKLPNMTVAAKVASFDSLSLSGFVHEARWRQWEADSLRPNSTYTTADRWKHVWTTGTKLDLRIGSNSLAYGAGEGGSDIGAVQSLPSSKARCASTDTCNSLTVTDDSRDPATLYVRIVNNGTTALTLGSPISYAPQGSYAASGQEYSVASGGGSLLYPLTITDPSFDIPTGTYYITVRIPITDAGQRYLTLNVTINKSVYEVE